jgi:16S rRNA (uracil1498-N3)-methyltransferase
MRRFFVPPELCRDDVFELPEREARHATQVLRLVVGAELTVLNGAGAVLDCVVETVTKKSVRIRVTRRAESAPLRCGITLVQAIPKGPAFETIVQKATELGATRIIPLVSERVVVHVSGKDAPAKVEKWRQIAIESIKQCGSPFLPKIELPVDLESCLTQNTVAPDELSVVCSLEESKRTLREAMETFATANQRPPKSCRIWIGPEGDFTPAEYAAIAASGATPISLGPLVLRADTAAIACLAIANHELQLAR